VTDTLRSTRPRIAWHRRLETHVTAGVALIVGVSLIVALITATIAVRARSLEQADTELASTQEAFTYLVESRAGAGSVQARLLLAQPLFRATIDALRGGAGPESNTDQVTFASSLEGYRGEFGAAFLVVTDERGNRLAFAGADVGWSTTGTAITSALAGTPAHAVTVLGTRMFLVVSEPARFLDEVIGTFTAGYELDDAVAVELSKISRSDVSFLVGSQVVASSLDAERRAALAAVAASIGRAATGPVQTTLAGRRYVIGATPLGASGAGGALVLAHDRESTERFLSGLRVLLLATGAAVFLIAVLAGISFSQRLTRPLSEIAEAAGRVAEGQWTLTVPERGSAEITAMARALNEMTAGLRHWHDEALDASSRLQQAQKMEAVGRLAGGVAHDFNNLLTAIRGYSEEVFLSLDASDGRRADMQEVLDAADRAAALTKQLLVFSRKQVVSPRVLALGDVIAGTEKMLGRLIGEDVTLTSQVAPGVPSIRADPGQIDQVLVNLVVNARDAMPTGGEVRIAVDEVVRGEVRYVRLTVADNGSGMDEATRQRIFEPFFTTKEEGRGTGLGLATVYSIVEQSGGIIEVESELGRGTTFSLYFPAVDEAPTLEEPLAAADLHPGTETLLLVEDDSHVRALIARSLRGAGYTVLEAESGGDALSVAREHAGDIALLLTDVVMPGISGTVLAELLTLERPTMRVLLMSGYSDDAVGRHGVHQPGGAAFIQKPFAMEALAGRIREVLGS
jgi:signal transduction histidine kinase